MRSKDYYTVDVKTDNNDGNYRQAYYELIKYIFDKGTYIPRETLTKFIKESAGKNCIDVDIKKSKTKPHPSYFTTVYKK